MKQNDDIHQYLFTMQAEPPFRQHSTALLIIDMQYYDAHADYGICKKAKEDGEGDRLLYYEDKLQQIVPCIRRLQDSFRAKGMEVIHARIASLTKDGRDRSRQHSLREIMVPIDSKEAEILDELKPVGDEIVFSKTLGNVFASTNIDYILRNIGIEQLVIAGVVTHGCVEEAVRSGISLNYAVCLVEDACASFSEDFHNNAINELSNTLATIRTTEDVISEIEGLQVAESKVVVN